MCNSKQNHENLQAKLKHSLSCIENTAAKKLHAKKENN